MRYYRMIRLLKYHDHLIIRSSFEPSSIVQQNGKQRFSRKDWDYHRRKEGESDQLIVIGDLIAEYCSPCSTISRNTIAARCQRDCEFSTSRFVFERRHVKKKGGREKCRNPVRTTA